MSRLHKKCMLASALTHGVLLLLVFVGSAFLAPKTKPNDLPILDFIDGKIIDEAFYGGGNPKSKPSPPLAPPPPSDPPPLLPPVREEKVEKPEPEKQPPKVQEPKIAKEKDVKDESREETKPEKHVVKVSTNVVKRTLTNTAAVKTARQEKERADADAKAQARQSAAAKAALNRALGSLNRNLSSGTALEPFGPGGEAFINYGQLVKTLYDKAWIVSDQITDDDSTARVRIEVARDGHVLTARIITPSGNPALDKSVQRALNDVRFIAPFPEQSKDSRRIFHINFNLKAKRLLG